VIEIFLVYLIVILIRVFLFHHPIGLYTHDGALYGYYAKLLLNNLPHTTDNYLPEYLLFFIHSITKIPLDTLLFYLPAFLSSLIVFPTYLISKEFMKKEYALFSAFIAGIGFGFYSRSYLGYFDTDILNLFFVYMIIYYIIKQKIEGVVVFNILFSLWYHSSLPIIGAINLIYLFYLLYKKEFLKSLLLIFSIIPINTFAKISIITILYALKPKININKNIILLITLILAIFFAIYFKEIIFHIKRYIQTSTTFTSYNLHFIAPMQYIKEASKIGAINTINSIIANIYLFALSVIGAIALIYKDKRAIYLVVPFFIGLMAIVGGIRFHIYAIPAAIIFLYYLIYRFDYKKIVLIIFSGYLTYENYRVIKFWDKYAKAVFSKEAVKALRNINSPGYGVIWWDWGWAVWYYANLKTIIDNGRHHEDNYFISKIFFSNQKEARDLICKGFNLFSKNPSIPAIIQLQNFKQKNCKHLNNRFFIIPTDEIKLLYTIFKFSNIDLKTGKKLKNHTFIYFHPRKFGNFYLFNNIRVNPKKMIIYINNYPFSINYYYEVSFKNNKKIVKFKKRKGALNIIKIGDDMLLIDNFFLNSTILQLFLNRYNPKYFSPVYIGKDISIYKIN